MDVFMRLYFVLWGQFHSALLYIGQLVVKYSLGADNWIMFVVRIDVIFAENRIHAHNVFLVDIVIWLNSEFFQGTTRINISPRMNEIIDQENQANPLFVSRLYK